MIIFAWGKDKIMGFVPDIGLFKARQLARWGVAGNRPMRL